MLPGSSSGVGGRLRRYGVVAVSAAMLVTTAACGNQASDAELVEALRAGTAAVQADPAAVAPGAVAAGVDASTGGVGPADAAAGAAAPGVAANTGADGTVTTNSGTTSSGSANSGGTKAQSSGAQAAGKPAAANSGPLVANKSLVKFGQIGTFSGVLGAISGGTPKALGAWVAFQNARGGLNGHPIKVIVGDDQGDPTTSLTLARRMVESDGVLAFVGNTTFFGYEQLEPYARSKNVPVIMDGMDEVALSSPISFPTLSNFAIQIVRGMEYAVKQEGKSKLAMVYCLEVAKLCTYAHDVVMKSEMGKHVAQSHQASLVAPSYTSQCVRMKSAGIDLLYMLMDTAAAARLVQDCATQGFKPTTMLLGLDATPAVPKMPALKDILVPGATASPGASLPAMDTMLKGFSAYAPGLGVGGFEAFGWTAGLMLGIAGEKLPDNPTSADILAGLWTVKNNDLGGLTSPITYTKGKGPQVKPCMFLWGVSNGKWSAPQGAKAFC